MLTAMTLALPRRTNIPRPTKKDPKDTPDRVFNDLARSITFRTEGVLRNSFCLNDSSGVIHFCLKSFEWFIQDHSVAWMIPGHSFYLNDSFRTIQLLEWLYRGICYAWMIHSGPIRCLNDLFSRILQSVLAIMFSIRLCGEISIIFITYEKHVWNWTY